MCTCLKRFITMLVLSVALLLIQSCSAPQQAARPEVALPAPPAPPAVAPNEIHVFYDSDPPGAQLYEMGKNETVGETPFWATYRLTDSELQAGEVFIEPSRVIWPSGAASSNYPGFVFDLKKGREQTFTFLRPNVPGLEADYEAGLKRLMHRYEKGEGGAITPSENQDR